jgi:hypothetical protein
MSFGRGGNGGGGVFAFMMKFGGMVAFLGGSDRFVVSGLGECGAAKREC